MGCLFSRMSRNAACARVDEKTGLLPRNTSASRLPATAARPIASGAALSASAVAARLNGGTQARQQQAAFSAKYDLCQVIGMGSTSVCHRCVERSTKKEFACKVIDKHRVDKSLHGQWLEQFLTETEVMMALQATYQHPNIIRLENVFITENKIYMCMELMTGGELFDYVVNKGTLSEAEASRILAKITSAVDHMHQQGIIHRDLKPENLLLTHAGADAEVKIIDFGLSKMLPDRSMAGSFLGTRGYIAPEMLKRQAYDKAVDIWALGVIAFILLCGCLPFDDDSSKITSDKVVEQRFTLKYPKWAKALSPKSRDFLSKLLQTDPSKRATAAEALEHAWLTTTAPPTPLASPRRIKNLGSRRRPPPPPPPPQSRTYHKRKNSI